MVAAAAEKRFGIPLRMCGGPHFVEIAGKLVKAGKIFIKKRLRFFPRDRCTALRKSRAERIDPHPVEDAEIDDFGLSPHIFGYLVPRDVKDLGGDGGVYIFSVLENLNKFFVTRKYRCEPKLDL